MDAPEGGRECNPPLQGESGTALQGGRGGRSEPAGRRPGRCGPGASRAAQSSRMARIAEWFTATASRSSAIWGMRAFRKGMKVSLASR